MDMLKSMKKSQSISHGKCSSKVDTSSDGDKKKRVIHNAKSKFYGKNKQITSRKLTSKLSYFDNNTKLVES